MSSDTVLIHVRDKKLSIAFLGSLVRFYLCSSKCAGLVTLMMGHLLFGSSVKGQLILIYWNLIIKACTGHCTVSECCCLTTKEPGFFRASSHRPTVQMWHASEVSLIGHSKLLIGVNMNVCGCLSLKASPAMKWCTLPSRNGWMDGHFLLYQHFIQPYSL